MLVNDGEYSPITVNKTLIISSLHGYENCIINGNGVKRCVQRTGGYPQLYGFTVLSGGIISGDGQTGNGAGICVFSIVKDCIISCCYTYSNQAGTDMCASCINCVYADNFADGYGIASSGRFYNCHFYNNAVGTNGNWGKSIIFQAYSIENCLIENNMPRQELVHANGSRTVIKNSIIRNNIPPVNVLDLLRDCLSVENCLIYDNGDATHSYNNLLYGPSYVRNCTIYNNNIRIADLRTGNYICNIANTILSKIQVVGVSAVLSISNCRINEIVNDTQQLSSVNLSNCISGPDAIDLSTLHFLNFDRRDFRLSSNSPCINEGNYDLISFSGRDLNNRLYKNPPSIGCYQYYPPGNIPNKQLPFG